MTSYQCKLTAGVCIAFLGGALVGIYGGFAMAAGSCIIFVLAVLVTENPHA